MMNCSGVTARFLRFQSVNFKRETSSVAFLNKHNWLIAKARLRLKYHDITL